MPVEHIGCPECSQLFLPVSCVSEEYACQQHCLASCACCYWLSLWMPWKVFGHNRGSGMAFFCFGFVFQVLILQWCLEREVLTLPWHLPQSVVLSMFSIRGNFQIDWSDPLQNQIFLNCMCFQFVHTFSICPMPIWSCKKQRLRNL